MSDRSETKPPADEGRLEPPVRPQRVDWHGHGLGWALADAMETGGGHWTLDDVARAFAAGAKVALAMQEKTEMSPEFTRGLGSTMNDDAAPREVGSTEGLGAWVPVAERLPEPGAAVLVVRGKHVMRAVHVPHMAFCEATHGYFEPEGAAYYDEATDETYWPDGWYEWNEHEDTHWRVDREPTHWMPMPAPPASA